MDQSLVLIRMFHERTVQKKVSGHDIDSIKNFLVFDPLFLHELHEMSPLTFMYVVVFDKVKIGAYL